MKHLLIIVAFVGLTGCQRGMIHVSAIRPAIETTLARHDAYVRADDKLQPPDKSTYLRTSDLLRKTLDEASK